jgi:hypothetical protein
MDSVQEGVTIADFSLPDQPLIYANHGTAVQVEPSLSPA